MDCLNVNVNGNQRSFNWDDIEVGNIHLDHSENFFAKKHLEHEKLDDLEVITEHMACAGLQDEKINPFDKTEFNFENKENTSPNRSPKTNTLQLHRNPTPKVVKSECLETNELEEATQNVKNENTGQVLDVSAKPTKAPPNIACMWSTQKPIVAKSVVSKSGTGAVAKNVRPPHAYEFKDLYERRRQEAKLRRLEEERKMREFHSRPVPNFNNYHQQMVRKQVMHVVTYPLTPNVLKKSRETEEKRKRRLEQIKLQKQPPKIHAREANVLKEEPFVPKKTQTVIETRPFNLRSERRLQERKQFDVSAQRALEEKLKQVQNEEEERAKREKEQVREIRKLATFKARPNPFK